jgi:hypothetical protein
MNPDFRSRLERLEASRARALSLLLPHDATALNRAPGPGRWSALQVLHHVIESEATLASLEGRLVLRHPFAGRMGLADALAVLQAHLDHHVPQVVRALEEGG